MEEVPPEEPLVWQPLEDLQLYATTGAPKRKGILMVLLVRDHGMLLSPSQTHLP